MAPARKESALAGVEAKETLAAVLLADSFAQVRDAAQLASQGRRRERLLGRSPGSLLGHLAAGPPRPRPKWWR